MVKYALAIFPEEKRCLVSISRNMISFNISGYLTFGTAQQAEDFRSRWENHFFDLKTLVVIKVEER